MCAKLSLIYHSFFHRSMFLQAYTFVAFSARNSQTGNISEDDMKCVHPLSRRSSDGQSMILSMTMVITTGRTFKTPVGRWYTEFSETKREKTLHTAQPLLQRLIEPIS